MKTKTIISYWGASNFDKRLNDFLEYIEANQFEIIQIDYRHNWAFYCASILYK
ncbi:hypothetical protein ACWOC1_03520 [Enterococcus quebecensis]|uniref:hypothetical protein n=1 Tax=Enterococcus quebecensis TaxID=903983 RepID=UPI0009176201|nr:hypothetical protein [Enterococcus quebecensis]OJG74727.1 hypothetical protein RV12_GL002144 [Enterococcus quebecensis]